MWYCELKTSYNQFNFYIRCLFLAVFVRGMENFTNWNVLCAYLWAGVCLPSQLDAAVSLSLWVAVGYINYWKIWYRLKVTFAVCCSYCSGWLRLVGLLLPPGPPWKLNSLVACIIIKAVPNLIYLVYPCLSTLFLSPINFYRAGCT